MGPTGRSRRSANPGRAARVASAHALLLGSESTANIGRGSDRTLEFLRQKEAAHPEIEFVTLPRYAPVVLLREPEPKGT